MTNVPLSTYEVSKGDNFYIDLGSLERVDAVYFLIKNGNADLKVYTGRPGSWIENGTISMQGYYSWSRISINRETRFLKFDFSYSYGEIVEIAVLGQYNQKIAISTIGSEGSDNAYLTKLIDEQEKVECPPTYMSQTYFDEIYYVRTAEEYMKLKEPYEWTHPPLGKLIIAAGISIFGYDPFGWRIMGVTFATLMIPVIYFLAKRLIGTWFGALASAFLLMFDFMHFTMGRISTVDTFVVFFSLTSQFFFLIYFQDVLRNGWKASIRPLFLAVLFFALGFSTKWYVLYGFVGQIFLLLALRVNDVWSFKGGLMARIKTFFGRPFFMLLGFLVVAVAIYLLTFVPYMMVGHTLRDVYDMQWSMYSYHSTLTATHPFSSEWWTWPLILRPVWLYVSALPNGLVSTIAAMGNPAIWWFGFASIIFAVEKAIRGKNIASIFITTMFFFQWLPYAVISRCLFLYHFYVNVPFLCLAVAYFLNDSWSGRRGKVIVVAYLVVVAALFALFYPVLSGYPAPYWWSEHLRWIRSWVF
jgi:dolichyl-phosphate-mannose--protein O-mannosyl transferase